jgi:hypothetical protein
VKPVVGPHARPRDLRCRKRITAGKGRAVLAEDREDARRSGEHQRVLYGLRSWRKQGLSCRDPLDPCHRAKSAHHHRRASPQRRAGSLDPVREACHWLGRRAGNRARLTGWHPCSVVQKQLTSRHHNADVGVHAHDVAELEGFPSIEAAARHWHAAPAVNHLTGHVARVPEIGAERLGACEVGANREQCEPHAQCRPRQCGGRRRIISISYPMKNEFTLLCPKGKVRTLVRAAASCGPRFIRSGRPLIQRPNRGSLAVIAAREQQFRGVPVSWCANREVDPATKNGPVRVLGL